MSADEKFVLDWLKFANKDADFLKSICKNPDNLIYFKSQVLFQCQQSIEKFLKALLLFYKIDFPRTHQLEKLQELFLSSGYNDVEDFDFMELSGFAVDARYPDEYEEPTSEEMNYYIHLVSEIKILVESKIKFISS